MIGDMDNDEYVLIIVCMLLAVLLGPFAFFFVMPSVLMVMINNPILSGLTSGAVGSAFVLGVVRYVNRRDTRRPVNPPDETPDAAP